MEMIGLIIAIVGSAMGIIGVVISMMYWVKTESNNTNNRAHEDRKELVNIVRAIESEMKDFHYRLLEIEKNRK